MSGHLRICFAGLALVGGLSSTPAFSNPFVDFFKNAPHEDAATTSSPQEECLPQPGNSTGEGQRWVYRRDGHRKCWFLAEGIATVQRPVHRRAVNRGAGPNETDKARRRRSSVADARAELPRSAPAEGVQPTPLAGQIKVADAASVFSTGTSDPMRTAPITNLPPSQLTLEQFVSPQVDVEKLLSVGRDADEKTSARSAVPAGMRLAEASDQRTDWMASWVGLLLMVLGVVAILSSSGAFREACAVSLLRERWARGYTNQ
ncbi:hypothetical protein [Bradyrhizobium sp. STM 3557]|uniref:hypothetical protein n=1 Tax=Bradyrhizobium sp. STM 3557 TaxID=578920 RepID=UPI00388F080C